VIDVRVLVGLNVNCAMVRVAGVVLVRGLKNVGIVMGRENDR